MSIIIYLWENLYCSDNKLPYIWDFVCKITRFCYPVFIINFCLCDLLCSISLIVLFPYHLKISQSYVYYLKIEAKVEDRQVKGAPCSLAGYIKLCFSKITFAMFFLGCWFTFWIFPPCLALLNKPKAKLFFRMKWPDLSVVWLQEKIHVHGFHTQHSSQKI